MAVLAATATDCARPRDGGRAACDVDAGCDSAWVRLADGGAARLFAVDSAGMDSRRRAAWWWWNGGLCC